MKYFYEIIICFSLCIAIFFISIRSPQKGYINNLKKTRALISKEEIINKAPIEFIKKKKDRSQFKQDRISWINNYHLDGFDAYYLSNLFDLV